MRTGIPKSATKLLHSSSRALAVDEVFEVNSPVEQQIRGPDIRRLRVHEGTCRGAIELAPHARREKLRHVGRDPELARRHRQEVGRLDAEQLAELVLAVELGPRQVQQPEERLEDALPVDGARLEHRLSPASREGAELLVGADSIEIALVELDDERHLPQAEAQILEVLAQVEERGGVVLGLADLRVGDERHAVGPLQDELAGRRVEHLSRNGEDLDPQRHGRGLAGALGVGAQGEGQHVEEERPVVLGLERHEAPARPVGRELVERTKVGRLPAESGAVVDELERDLATAEVDLQ